MDERLMRVGTTYIPVQNLDVSVEWYRTIGAALNYRDQDKAILDLANQSFFLVNAEVGQSSNFYDANGKEHFLLTFEVDGLASLELIHNRFRELGIAIGNIEDRGHTGRNFVFKDPDGNMFDVWSELSPQFKEKFKEEVE
ncbi:VOC family protein [Virgibacillus kekensis]|uniref:VOC family protein n=1 Tax=Virgibacillus kekensis TaxID=202261 RepID=A0ABV9DN91_9BACI